MLGYDVYYSNLDNDNSLLEIAFKEERILLTCDQNLFKRASICGIKSFLLRGRTQAEKLAELAIHLNIRLRMNIQVSRCPLCNTKIRSISKNKINGKIPHFTSLYCKEFWFCSNCKQIYWKGSHWKKIEETLFQAQKIQDEQCGSNY
jgi:uncharacterized protein with PIN domain